MTPRQKKQGKRGKNVSTPVKRGTLYSLSFMDGFLMGRTLLGDTRAAALSAWENGVGHDMPDLKAEYLHQKHDAQQAIYYTEDFVKGVPELESWMTGLALVLLNDTTFGGQVEALGNSPEGLFAQDLMALMESVMYAGPLAAAPKTPEMRQLIPVMQRRWVRFQAEVRGMGLRKRLDYIGKLLGLIEAVAQGKLQAPVPTLQDSV